MRRWAESLELDIVNLQYQAAAYSMAAFIHIAPMRINTPTVTTFHDLRPPYLFPKAGPLRFQAILTLARSSAGVIVTNVEDYERLQGENVRHLARIPIGSNIAVCSAPVDGAKLRESVGIPEGAFLVGYFGFLNKNKGVDTLVKGAADAIRDGLNLELVMIGGRTGSSDPTNAGYAREIEALIDGEDIADHVHWTGFVDEDEVSAWLCAADCVALPFRDGASFRRGTFMAALAHGCPIITTTPAVRLPEIKDGQNVRLIPPDSPSAFATTVKALAANDLLRRRLGEGALALSHKFDWDQIGQDTARFFALCLGR
jgi:glycosyltransferase involved in cell wall biosynthesis